MKTIINEFKEFIMRGNVLDLAVGVIIGGAFQKIISSLVNDVIMPVSYTHLDVYKRQIPMYTNSSPGFACGNSPVTGCRKLTQES